MNLKMMAFEPGAGIPESGSPHSARKDRDRQDACPTVCVALNPAIDRVIRVPRLTVGGLHAGQVLGRYAAGKAINVARVLSALGVDSTVTGLVGEDSIDFFDRSLAGTRCRPAFVRVPGATRENVTIIQQDRPGDTHLRCDNPPVPRKHIEALTDVLLDLAEEGTTLVFAGSLPAGMTPAHFQRLLRAVQTVGARVVVDTSGPALRTAVEAGVWLLKPNVAELAELVGENLSATSRLILAARAVCSDGREVLVSAGAKGAFLVTPQQAWRAACPVGRSHVISTVGAGDTLLAGYLAATTKNLPCEEALRHAVAAATAGLACTQCAQVRKGNVQRLLRHTRLWPLA